MPFVFDNLDPATRQLMIEELKLDLAAGRAYISPRLSPAGQVGYVGALEQAMASGTEQTLGQLITDGGFLNARETSRSKTGKTFEKDVPRNAHETLAEGEFNRYYLRALCLRAIKDGVTLEVYRAKAVANPRPESEAKLGVEVDPAALLADLRNNAGIDTFLKLPPGPNSGLSARIKT